LRGARVRGKRQWGEEGGNGVVRDLGVLIKSGVDGRNPTLYKYPQIPHHTVTTLLSPLPLPPHTRAAQAARTRQNGELSRLSAYIHRASHLLRL